MPSSSDLDRIVCEDLIQSKQPNMEVVQEGESISSSLDLDRVVNEDLIQSKQSNMEVVQEGEAMSLSPFIPLREKMWARTI